MIKIDKKVTEISGNNATIIAEIMSLFISLNKYIDESKPFVSTMEELIVCNEIAYKEFCRLAVRLNEAHKRVEKKVNKNDR